MKDYKLCLNQISQIKPFIETVEKIDCDIDLVSGRYVIDAKSIVGIFTLDLSKTIILRVHEDEEKALKEIEEKLKPYIEL